MRCSRLIDEDEKSNKDVRGISKELKVRGIEADTDDVEVVLRYRDTRFAFGDMYDDIRTIEIGLHALIRNALEATYGKDKWWRHGVPLAVRVKCRTRHEEDDDPVSDPFGYTDVLDLCKIAEKEWKVIGPKLPKEVAANRKGFAEDLGQLNRIRRMVMHHIRGATPSEDDFQFVHELKRKLNFLENRGNRGS